MTASSDAAPERSWDSYRVTPGPGQVHPGRVLLERAHAGLILVDNGEMCIEEAIMGLADAFWDLVHPMHNEDVETYERMERLYPHVPPKPSSPKRGAA